MSNPFRYKHRHVRDIACEGGFVRVWDADGDMDRTGVAKAFAPLVRTGLIHPYIALMPDHHPAEGSMVGSVIPTRDVLLLTVIGGDLGCGVAAVKLPVTAEEARPWLGQVHAGFQDAIPSGTAHNRTVTERVADNPIWRQELHADVVSNKTRKKLMLQFASLGGGNHFLEVQEDDDGQAWVMLHSGSRYLGVLIRDYYVHLSSTAEGVNPNISRRAPYLPAQSALGQSYLADLGFALRFARESRHEMMLRALEVLARHVPGLRLSSVEEMARGMLDIAHNYVAQEEHFGETLFVHRKGAVRAGADETVMIPGSMGTTSYIAGGTGNGFAFCSCSHGAGRAMSRHAAVQSISDKDFAQSIADVLHTPDYRLKDEAPAAYKDIHLVMRGQKDLVKIQTRLSPLLSLKGAG